MKILDYKRLFKAIKYSSEGLIEAVSNHTAFKQELLIFIILTPLAIIVGNSFLEISILIFSVILVLVIEIINTAIEIIVDRISTEKHELSKKAKDLGSAAVLIALLNMIIIWGLIIVPKFL